MSEIRNPWLSPSVSPTFLHEFLKLSSALSQNSRQAAAMDVVSIKLAHELAQSAAEATVSGATQEAQTAMMSAMIANSTCCATFFGAQSTAYPKQTSNLGSSVTNIANGFSSTAGMADAKQFDAERQVLETNAKTLQLAVDSAGNSSDGASHKVNKTQDSLAKTLSDMAMGSIQRG
jgi:hypothetical protein